MRMTKVSKPTATRDLEELVKIGAIIREGESVATRYRLNFQLDEPIDEPLEPLNETLNEPPDDPLFETIKSQPGISRAELIVRAGKSRATVARAVAALIAEGKIEHRGSKKTGGYYAR